MTLAKLLKKKRVHHRFKGVVGKPESFQFDGPLKAPPCRETAGPVGTAMNYLLRLWVEASQPVTAAGPWLAEKFGTFSGSGLGENLSFAEQEAEILDEARAARAKYLDDHAVDEALLRAVLKLARVDACYRSDEAVEDLHAVDEEDVRDLRTLMDLVDPAAFRPTGRCVVNATFGPATRKLADARADLVIDRTLVCIKTSTKPGVERRRLHFLVACCLLANTHGIDRAEGEAGIDRIAIYNTRYGTAIHAGIEELLPSPEREELRGWFDDEVARMG